MKGRMMTTRQVLTIEHDQYPMNPREWDNLGTLYYRYYNGAAGSEWYRECGDLIGRGPLGLHEYLRGESIALKVRVPGSMVDRYAGEAYMIASKDDLRAEYGDEWRSKLEHARQYLEAAAEEWALWRDGYVYAFTLTTEHECTDTPGEWHEDTSESVCGFIGEGPDVIDHLDGYVPDELLDPAREAWTGEYPVACKVIA